MGKHKKAVDCSSCNGKKGKWVTDNGHGKKRWEPCAMCNGTGKQ